MEVRAKILSIKTTILSAFASPKMEVRKNQKGSNYLIALSINEFFLMRL